MKRDWDLIRTILTEAETKPPGEMLLDTEISGFDVALVRNHIAMMHDAGYLKAALLRGTSTVVSATVLEIEFSGFDLLDTIRSKSVWEKIRKLSKDKGLELTFDTVKKLGVLAVEHIIAG